MRSLTSLKPEVHTKANKLLALAEARGLTILIYCTLRTYEEQARLYRQGRSFSAIKAKADELQDKYHRPDLDSILLGVGAQEGRRVTNAAPGQSLHNYGLAFDAVPVRDGKLIWDSNDPLWQQYGELVDAVGLEWAGHWKTFKEYPHVQLPGVRWQDLIVRREVRTVGV